MRWLSSLPIADRKRSAVAIRCFSDRFRARPRPDAGRSVMLASMICRAWGRVLTSYTHAHAHTHTHIHTLRLIHIPLPTV